MISYLSNFSFLCSIFLISKFVFISILFFLISCLLFLVSHFVFLIENSEARGGQSRQQTLQSERRHISFTDNRQQSQFGNTYLDSFIYFHNTSLFKNCSFAFCSKLSQTPAVEVDEGGDGDKPIEDDLVPVVAPHQVHL